MIFGLGSRRLRVGNFFHSLMLCPFSLFGFCLVTSVISPLFQNHHAWRPGGDFPLTLTSRDSPSPSPFPATPPLFSKTQTKTSPGTLFRFDSNLYRTPLKHSLTIPNGLGWSHDQSTMYFTHSTEKRILAFTYSPSDGSITNERTVWQHDGSGDPDGFKMDEEGCIWHAIYGEGRVWIISF
jgi:hypothetical protein